MATGIGLNPSRFLAWWLGELRACLPGAATGILFGTAERLEVALGAGNASFVLRRNGRKRELGSVSLNSGQGKDPRKAANRLLRRAGAPRRRVTLRLPAGQVLQPTIEVPVAAADNLREVLALEMDRHTPFSPEEVLFDFHVAGSDAEMQRLRVEMLIARKDDIARARTLAGTMGLSPDSITGPAAGENSGAPGTGTFNLLPRDERPRPGRMIPRLVGAMAVVTLALAGVSLAIKYDRKQKTLALLEARVTELRASTGETGKLEDKVARLLDVSGYLREEKRRRPQMVEILDEVTRRLPDQHWLISYSFRDGKIQLAGYSDDPSSVLLLLEQSGLFSGARFAAPVTMDPRIGKERFNLVATVAREDEPQ